VIEIRRYVTRAGKDPLGEWLTGLKDIRARAKIAIRITRVATGNFGDSKRLSQGLYELRIRLRTRLPRVLRNGRQNLRFAIVWRR
jgi:putative component of toxin-antitoxin plasmid stabilization module